MTSLRHRLAQLTFVLALAACGGGVATTGTGSSGSSGTNDCSPSPSGGACKPDDVPTVPPTIPPTIPPTGGRVPKVHRAVAQVCTVAVPMEPMNVTDAGPPFVECHSNAECTTGKNGRCDGNGHDGYRCTYDECYADNECTSGGVCACNGASRATNNICLTGGCRIDSDCGGTGYCSPTLGSCGHYGKATGYYCHTTADECVDDEDCAAMPGSFGQTGYCAYEETVGHWKCSTAECAG